MSEQPEISTSVLVRRYIAIGLIAVLILFMFVLPIIGLNGDSEAFRSYWPELQYRQKTTFAQHFASEWMYNARYSSYMTGTYDEALKTGEQFYDILDHKGASFMTLLSFLPNLMRYAGAPTQVTMLFTVLLYVMFFLILAFALAAILMMLFNKSKVFNILLLVFSLIICGVFLFFGIAGYISVLSDGSYTTSPVSIGAASILIPVLALAALIVYKRTRKPAPAAAQSYTPYYPAQPAYQPAQPTYPPQNYLPPQPSYQPVQPSYQPQNYQQPSYEQSAYGQPSYEQPSYGQQQPSYQQQGYRQAEAEPSQPAFWTCPVCGAKNPTSSQFCPNCGTGRD